MDGRSGTANLACEKGQEETLVLFDDTHKIGGREQSVKPEDTWNSVVRWPGIAVTRTDGGQEVARPGLEVLLEGQEELDYTNEKGDDGTCELKKESL